MCQSVHFFAITLFMQTWHTPALILETTDQVLFGHHGRHPLCRLFSCLMTFLPLLKVIVFLVTLIWVNVRVADHKDIQLNNVLFIDYCYSLQLLLRFLDHNNNGNLVFPNNGSLNPHNIGNHEQILPLPLLLKTLVGISIVVHHNMSPLT